MEQCASKNVSQVDHHPDWFVDPDDFKSAMRQLASGVSLITAGQGANRRGLTATAVCSLSTSPPSLVVCVNRQTEGAGVIRETGHFCVNIVAAEHQFLAQRFAGQDGARGLERFLQGDWIELKTGAPVLADAIAAFDCEVLDLIERETHLIIIGGVRAARFAESRDALVYHSGAYYTLSHANRE